MKFSIARASLIVGCLAAALALAPGAAAKVPSSRTKASSLLFVQETDGGAIERVHPGVFRLRLDGVSPSVSTFTDRPHRRAGVQGLDRFVGTWNRNGFAEDPPNAALVLHRAPRSRDVAMLTLSHPRYDRRRETLTYRVTPLHGSGARSLAALAKRADPVRPRRFGGASLFIDDSGGAAYEHVVIQFAGVEFGERLQLEASAGDVPIAWSLGAPGNQLGLQLSSFEGSPPISRFAIDRGSLEMEIGPPEGGPPQQSFAISLFLEAPEPIDQFYLTSSISPNVQATVTAGQLPPQQIVAGQSLFLWQPS